MTQFTGLLLPCALGKRSPDAANARLTPGPSVIRGVPSWDGAAAADGSVSLESKAVRNTAQSRAAHHSIMRSATMKIDFPSPEARTLS